MITDIILNVVFSVVNVVLSPVAFMYNLPTSGLEYLTSVLSTVSYFLPMAGLMPLMLFFVALMSFRVAIALIKTIWDLLPIL